MIAPLNVLFDKSDHRKQHRACIAAGHGGFGGILCCDIQSQIHLGDHQMIGDLPDKIAENAHKLLHQFDQTAQSFAFDPAENKILLFFFGFGRIFVLALLLLFLFCLSLLLLFFFPFLFFLFLPFHRVSFFPDRNADDRKEITDLQRELFVKAELDDERTE